MSPDLCLILLCLIPGKFWLHQALSCLSSALEHIGSHLVFLRPDEEREGIGSSLLALRSLVRETGAQTVLASALYEPWLRERDQVVVSALQKDRVELNMVHSYCLRDPYTVTTEGVGLRGMVILLLQLLLLLLTFNMTQQ